MVLKRLFGAGAPVGRLKVLVALLAAAALFNSVAASASSGCKLFGAATRVTSGLEAGAALFTTQVSPFYSGIDIAVPPNFKFTDLNLLSTEYTFINGTCAAGSPRFQVNVTTTITVPGSPAGTSGNVFVYIGPAPFGTGCVPNVETMSGNLAVTGGPGDVPGRRDSSQINPGTQVSTYNAELAFATAGGWQVTGLQLVADGTNQLVIEENVHVNNHVCFADPTPGCQEGDGNGDFQGEHHGNFQADGDGCMDGDEDSVSSTDRGDGKDFQSTQIDSIHFDTVANAMTISGAGLAGGTPVTFVFVAVETGLTTPGWVSFTFSDGYSNAGTLLNGSVLLH